MAHSSLVVFTMSKMKTEVLVHHYFDIDESARELVRQFKYHLPFSFDFK